MFSLITAGVLKEMHTKKYLQNLAGIFKKNLFYGEQYSVTKSSDDLFKNIVPMVVRLLFIGIKFVLKTFSDYSLYKVLNRFVS